MAYNINRRVDVIPLVKLTPKIRFDTGRKSLRLADNDKISRYGTSDSTTVL